MTEMNPTSTDRVESIIRRADEIERARQAVLRTLAESAVALDETRKAYEREQATYRDAFRSATQAGWTKRALTSELGLPAPDTAPRKRSKRRTATSQHDGRDQTSHTEEG